MGEQRRRQPWSIGSRMTLGLVAVAGLPTGLLAVLLALRETVTAADYRFLVGWLIASVVLSTVVALLVASRITRTLRTLEIGLREFDPELRRDPPAVPDGAPRELLVVFEQLQNLAWRLRRSYGELEDAVARGEKLRADLVREVEGRERLIAGRTEELRQANAALDRQIRSDPLTGVANRRGLAEALDRAWRAAARDGQAVSLLMIDIDHFKAYNDCYGHPQGDACLKAVANTLCHVAGRALDTVARYGGEEFAVVLGDTPLEGALHVAEQLRAAIEAMNVPHLAAPGRNVVTVSIGVTSTIPTRDSTAEAAIGAADRALYAAKEQGRNRVGYSTPAGTGLFRSINIQNGPPQRLS
jgi:diguanylate cyclase (GGDEF)-like protein